MDAPADVTAGASARPPGVAPGLPPEHSTDVRLSRDLGMLDATMLGVGALMGGGVFVLLGIAVSQAGPSLLLAFLLNGLVTLPTLMVYAELGSAFSDTGGGYLWIKEAMRQPWGFLGGWMSWFSHAIACAVYALASGFYLLWILRYVHHDPMLWLEAHPFHGIVPSEHHVIAGMAVLFALLFIFLNYIGVKVSIKTENLITYAVLVVVGAFLAFGVWKLHNNVAGAQGNFMDFMPRGYSGLFLAMGITFISFEGYEIISQTGEEIKNPKRTIPRAIWASLWIVWPIILLTTVVAVGLFPASAGADGHTYAHGWQALASFGPTALVEAANFVMPYGSILLVSCAALLQLVALNATIYSSSRVSFAMGRDHNLPAIFGHIHPTRRTPHWSVLVSGAIIVGMSMLPIEAVATAADIQFLLLFLLVNFSYLKLHRSLPAERFGYRAPLFPYIPIIGILTKFFLAVYLWQYSHVAWFVAGAILAGGLVFYWLYVRPRETQSTQRLQEHTVMAEPVAAQRRDYRILVPLTNPATVKGLALAARDIAVGQEGEVAFLYVVTLPSATPLEAGTRFVPQGQPLLDQAMATVAGDAPCSAIVRIGHDPNRTIRSAAQELGSSLILVGWKGQGGGSLATNALDDLIENPPCDLAIVKVVNTPPPQRILQPSHAGGHAALSLKLAGAIARSRSASVKLLRVVTPGEEGESTDEAYAAKARALMAQSLPRDVPAEVEVAHSKLLVSEILRRGRGHDLLVLGASRQPFWRTTMFGNKPEQIAAGFPGSVLMVKSYGGKSVENVRSVFRFFKVFRRMLKPD